MDYDYFKDASSYSSKKNEGLRKAAVILTGIFSVVHLCVVAASLYMYLPKVLNKKNKTLSFVSHVFNVCVILSFTLLFIDSLVFVLSDKIFVFNVLLSSAYITTTLFVGALCLIWFQSLRKSTSAAEMTQALTGNAKKEIISKKSQVIFFSGLAVLLLILDVI